MKKFICTVCGYVHEGDSAPATCPQCKQPANKFKELEQNEQESIQIKKCEVVDESFHARYSSHKKVYVYKIKNTNETSFTHIIILKYLPHHNLTLSKPLLQAPLDF